MNKRGIHWSLWVILLLEYIYIFYILFNYDITWMNPEKFWTHAWILENGSKLRWEDFVRAFNINVIELNPDRLSRPLSNIFEVIDTKFRASCWNYIPPHPSFSFLWAPFFIALPVFLFQFFRNLGCHSSVALSGTCLYLSSVGFLGPLVMLFHPAKSLANFFAILSLWVISFMYKKIDVLENGYSFFSMDGFTRNYLLGVFFMFLGFFSDETGLFTYLMVLALLIPIFHKAKERMLLWGSFLLVPGLYLLVLRCLLPYIHYVLRGHKVSVTNYELYPHLSSLFLPDLKNLGTNFCWLFSDYPHFLAHFHNILACKPVLVIEMIYAGLLSWMIYRFFRRNQSSIWLKRASLFTGLLIAYGFFQTFQLSANVRFWGVWWYGSLFSLIYFIVFTCVMQKLWEENGGFQKFFGCIIFILVFESLIYTTFRITIFKQQNLNRNNYTFNKVFNGTINPYTEFDFRDSMEKSRCKAIYTRLQWEQLKQKKLTPVDASVVDACKKKMYNNVYFPIEMLYLPIELGQRK